MGDATELKTTYKFSDDGKMLTVYNNWKTKSARFSHIPWVPRERRFVITLNTGKVEVEGENINTER
jgi:translation elongation factor EF-Tu-like GTPase